jgi:hypothetical protein
MNKILIVTNVLLLTTVGVLAFKINRGDFSSGNPGYTETFKSPPPLVDSLDGLLNDSLAVIMSHLYADDVNKSKMGGRLGKTVDDTRSVWFSLATLESFIYSIKHAFPDSNKMPKLGVRVFFAKYPDKMSDYESLLGLDSTIANHQTVFFVPNYLNDTTQRYEDFNFYELGDNPYQPIPYYKLLQDPSRHPRPVILSGHNKNAAPVMIHGIYVMHLIEGIQNHGGLTPPPAGEGSFPAALPEDN